jgi:hypothetical protein
MNVTQVLSQFQEANQKLIDHFTSNFKDLFEQDLFATIKLQATAFINAVDWKNERWIHGLIAFHVILLTIAIITRRKQNIQIVLFIFICTIIWSAERINHWAAQNWNLFSTSNYFDANGIFLSIMLSLPLLLISVIMLGNLLLQTASLLITVKRKQIIHEQRQKNKQDKKDR